MQTLYSLLGAAIIVLVSVDFFRTTLSLRGAGPLTSALMRAVWESFRFLSGESRRRLMAAAGPSTLVATLCGWVLLLWLGWFLIFWGIPDSVVWSSTKEPAGLTGHVYFVGFVLSTLGVGDAVPDGDLAQVLTPLAALHGLMVITIAITYLVGALSAGVSVRQLAAHVAALGPTPQALVLTGWNGRDFGGLEGHLTSIAPTLLQASQMYLAYPVLHYFYSEDVDVAPAVAIARLEEALSLLEHGLDDAHEPDPSLYRPVRRAVDTFLDKIGHRYGLSDSPPPALSLAPLQARGLRTVDAARYRESLEGRSQRRRALQAMVRNSGWSWDEVVGDAEAGRA